MKSEDIIFYFIKYGELLFRKYLVYTFIFGFILFSTEMSWRGVAFCIAAVAVRWRLLVSVGCASVGDALPQLFTANVHPREYERLAANMGDMGCERSERPIFSDHQEKHR